MAVRPLPSVEELHQQYEIRDGRLFWRHRSLRDPSDYRARKWNARFAGKPVARHEQDGYVVVPFYRKPSRQSFLLEHRVILKMLSGLEPEVIDHKNRVKRDNRLENLRPATAQQNGWNRIAARGKNLPKGVFAIGSKFRAAAGVNGRTVHIGHYLSPAAAHAAYCAFAAPRHGEFFNPGPERPTVFD